MSYTAHVMSLAEQNEWRYLDLAEEAEHIAMHTNSQGVFEEAVVDVLVYEALAALAQLYTAPRR